MLIVNKTKCSNNYNDSIIYFVIQCSFREIKKMVILLMKNLLKPTGNNDFHLLIVGKCRKRQTPKNVLSLVVKKDSKHELLVFVLC